MGANEQVRFTNYSWAVHTFSILLRSFTQRQSTMIVVFLLKCDIEHMFPAGQYPYIIFAQRPT